MKVQQTIKKVGAVAASTLMVGMTMGAAQSLSDFPGMFTDDDGAPTAELVVGSDGQVADVVGAVNVAAALGQETVQTQEQTETVSGSTTTTVDGGEYETSIGGNLGDSGDSDSETLDASDYSTLMRDTVTIDGTDHQVVEKVMVDDDAAGSVSTSTTNVDGDDYVEAGNVVTDLTDGAVEFDVAYTPGIPESEAISMLGKEYTVTSIESRSLLKIGAEVTHDGLQVGDRVEQGPFEVEVYDVDSENNKVRLRVYEDGQRTDSKTFTEGEYQAYGDDDEFNVTADSVFFGDNVDEVILETVYTDSDIEEGEDFPWDDRYTVDTVSLNDAGDAVEGVTISSQVTTSMPADDEDASVLDADQVIPLAEGDSFAGPLDYFTVDQAGFTDEETNAIEFSEDHVVDFSDQNAFDVSLNISEVNDGDLTTADEDWYVGVPDSDDETYPVEVTSWNGNNDGAVELSYQSWDHEFDIQNNGVTNVTLSSDGSLGDYVHASGTLADESGNDDEVAYNEISTGYGFSVIVEWIDDGTNGNIDSLNVYGNTADYTEPAYTKDNSNLGAGANISTEFGATLHEVSNLVTSDHISDTGSVDTATNLTYSDDDNTPEEVQVQYADGTGSDYDQDEIGAVVYNMGSEDTLTTPEDGQEVYTNFGTHLDVSSTSATAMLPENEMHVEHSVGSMTESAGEDSTVTYEGVTNTGIRGTLDDLSMLDSEITQSVRGNSDLILVGGPAVNTLVADLADDGETWTVDEWRNNHQDEALVEVVADAFADGQNALIVAGYQAQDTRAAAQYISNYDEHASEIEGNAQVTMTRGNYPGQ